MSSHIHKLRFVIAFLLGVFACLSAFAATCTSNVTTGNRVIPLRGLGPAVPRLPRATLSSSRAAIRSLQTLNFSSGAADFCLATSDVGKFSVSLRDDTGTQPVRGASSTLTVRPFAVTVSDVKQSSTDNPGGSGPGGILFTPAGSPFQAKAAGWLWNAASDTGNSGLRGSG